MQKKRAMERKTRLQRINMERGRQKKLNSNKERNETVAKRGSNDFSSCVKMYLEDF